LSNNKLVERGVKMIQKELEISEEEAKLLLEKHKNVRTAINQYHNG